MLSLFGVRKCRKGSERGLGDEIASRSLSSGRTKRGPEARNDGLSWLPDSAFARSASPKLSPWVIGRPRIKKLIQMRYDVPGRSILTERSAL